MAKFKLKSSSVHLGGIVYKAGKEPVIFDTDEKYKALELEVLAAEKAGFLTKMSKKEVDKLAKAEAEKQKAGFLTKMSKKEVDKLAKAEAEKQKAEDEKAKAEAEKQKAEDEKAKADLPKKK